MLITPTDKTTESVVVPGMITVVVAIPIEVPYNSNPNKYWSVLNSLFNKINWFADIEVVVLRLLGTTYLFVNANLKIKIIVYS